MIGASMCTIGLLLGGCQTTAVFDLRACPRERSYTAEEQAQMARDLDKSPPSIQRAFVDYGKLRDKARACRGEEPPKAKPTKRAGQ